MTAMPVRVQLHRTKGWRKPEGVVVVARPTRWGNPFRLGVDGDAQTCRDRYRAALLAGELAVTVEEVRVALAGHDLACWCRSDAPCHAEVLLEVANDPAGQSASGERGVGGRGAQ
jgi:Domain of unknown function (DUF4326)